MVRRVCREVGHGGKGKCRGMLQRLDLEDGYCH